MKKVNNASNYSSGTVFHTVGDEAFGFRVTEMRDLPDVSSRMWRMEFAANGVDLVWIETEDKDKTFAIAFRTHPDDDTGVAHIIEHSVLCGSASGSRSSAWRANPHVRRIAGGEVPYGRSTIWLDE